MKNHYPNNLGNVIKINNSEIQNHLEELVRGTVEERLNSMLDAEADTFCNAARYERTEIRANKPLERIMRVLPSLMVILH